MPSSQPSPSPSGAPSIAPTYSPTGLPTVSPSRTPSDMPSSLPTASPSVSPSISPSASPSESHQPSVSQQPSAAPTPVYEFENQILSVKNGRCIFSGEIPLNETEAVQSNQTTRLLQGVPGESECNALWAEYVRTAIQEQVILVIGEERIETLGVKVENVTRQHNSEERLLTLFFDVQVAIRSPVTNQDINRYIAAPFDSREEQDDFLLYLESTGCPDFASLDGVRFVLPAPPNASEMEDNRSNSAQAGLIAGLVAALSAGAILVGVFLFVRLRRETAHRELVEEREGEFVGGPAASARNEVISEVGVRTNQDVSTLGDPFPQGTSAIGASSTADSFSLDYDYQKAYMQQSPSTVSGSHSGESMSQLLVDDATLDAQYETEERIEVDAPAGVLGLVLETNVDGIPVVNAIKPNSVLARNVRIGDRLISVDGIDVGVMLASDVSKLIASKKNQSVRRFVFNRPIKA